MRSFDQLKKYQELTNEEKDLLSEEDNSRILELAAGFQKEEIRTEAAGVTVKSADGTMDVRTIFVLTDESASMGTWEEMLAETETLLNLFRPEFFLKNGALSMKDHAVRISMKAPALVNGKTGAIME